MRVGAGGRRASGWPRAATTVAGHRRQRSSCAEPTMNSMRAAVLWVYLLRGAALHDSPVDTLVAASRGTARVAEKVCFTRRGASSALCLPLLPAGNSNLCGGRTCYVMDRAVLSDAASVGAVGREGVVSHGIATPFPAEGMLGWESPHLPWVYFVAGRIRTLPRLPSGCVPLAAWQECVRWVGSSPTPTDCSSTVHDGCTAR
eukprot:COSAG01_NODE_6147_length_3824_cov_60.751946_2_plen_202_part_00